MDDPQALPCPDPGYDASVSGGAWGIVWLALIIKIPLFALLYLVWWAIKDPPVVRQPTTAAARPTATRPTRAAGRRIRLAAAPTVSRSPPRRRASASPNGPAPRRILR